MNKNFSYVMLLLMVYSLTSPLYAASNTLNLDLQAWDIHEPQAIRFALVTLSQKPEGWQLQGLSRLQTNLPQAQTTDTVTRLRPEFHNDELLLSRFESSGPHLLKGYYGSFARVPARSQISFQREVDGRRSLMLQTFKELEGFAGLWIQLAAVQHNQFLDARDVAGVSFWVRGRGEYLLKLADRRWFQREDAQLLGPLSRFLRRDKRLSGQWQEVWLPLEQLPASLNRSELANLVLEAQGPGPQTLHFSQLKLHLKKPAPQALPPVQHFKIQAQASVPASSAWVWHTQAWLDDPQRLSQEMAFLQARGIQTLYLQLPAAQRTQNPGEVVWDEVALAHLLQTLHQQGFRVQALDGDPRYALAASHQGVLKTVQRLLEFNRKHPPEMRFDGLQYDIEPYLLPGFFGPQREALYQSFLSLSSAVYQATQEAGLPLGWAIPAWLDQPDSFTGQRLSVSFQSQNRVLSEHLQLHSDYIALMNYRTQIWGAGGLLDQGRDELLFARQHNKRVVMGLETMPLPDEKLYLLRGQPSREAPLGTAALKICGQADAWQAQYLAEDQPRPASEAACWYWPLKHYADVLGKQLSYANWGPAHFEKQLQILQEEWAEDPAFGGLAVHHLGSYTQLHTHTEE